MAAAKKDNQKEVTKNKKKSRKTKNKRHAKT